MNRNEEKIRMQFNLFTVIINHSIAIQIGFFDHIVDFCLRQSFAQIGHDVTQFS